MTRITPYLLVLVASAAACLPPLDHEATDGTDEPILEEEHLSGSILTDKLLTADRTWILDDVVFVEAGAQLTIEPGTTIKGAGNSALIITRDAKLQARGKPEAPIVFTSSNEPGSRAPADWGGVVLLGNAPLNTGEGHLEGLEEDDSHGLFGGSDSDDSCGVVEYVRIEFAGYELNEHSELNGLTLAGCGRNTIIRYVHSHMSLDDGIEAVGGSVNLKNIFISYAGDEGLDWSNGWVGSMQFVIIQQSGLSSGAGVEGDNNEDDVFARPLTRPTIYNMTLMGNGDPTGAVRGMVFRSGTGAIVRNSIISGFPGEAFDVRDVETADNAPAGDLDITHTLLSYIGPDGRTYFDEHDDEGEGDDGGFDEKAWFDEPARFNATTVQKVLPKGLAAVDLADPGYKVQSMSFTPSITGPANFDKVARTPEDSFWDENASYIGAVRPAGDTGVAWWQGWTDFPAD